LCLAPALLAAEDSRLAWREDWPRFRTSEYVVTGVALAGSAANFYLVPPPRSSSWSEPILFDRHARDALLPRDSARREKAKDVSDLLSFPLIGYAMLDGPLTTAWAGEKDAALQLALINAETFAVTEVLNLTVSNLVPRRRPEGATCDPNTRYDPYCVKSFWSGHAANVFAAASLVCAEHGALALYGGKADGVACATALTVATAVGALRIAGNDHHASDVVIGAAVGAATGYVMPNLLHFKTRRARRFGYLVPRVGPRGGGLTYVVAW
jgi:membrane-associated phospholipid phosphatase